MNTLPTLTLVLAAAWGAVLPAQADAKAAEPKKESATLGVGSQVPSDLALKDLDGKSFSFAGQKDKIVVVHFWSMTCPWEKVAEPKLQKLTTDFKDKDVVVVAVNSNKGEIGAEPDAKAFEVKNDADKPYQNLRKHVAATSFNHTVLIDHSGDVARTFGAKTTPHCFVIDTKGVVQYAGGLDNDGRSEDVEPSKQYVRAAIEALKAGKKVEVTTSKPYG